MADRLSDLYRGGTYFDDGTIIQELRAAADQAESTQGRQGRVTIVVTDRPQGMSRREARLVERR